MPGPLRLRIALNAVAAAAAAVAAGLAVAGDGRTQLSVPDPASELSSPPRPASVKGDFTFVSVGDLLYSVPVARSADAELQQVLRILKDGDVAIGNVEGVFFDLRRFRGEAPGSPAILRGQPELAADLKAIGIDMVSTANNHANDWGAEGLLDMDRLLDHARIVHAGDGRTLTQAQSARFLDTPTGRIALVATASTFKEGARAQDAIDGMPARSGISTLRTREIDVVTAETMAHLRAAAGQPEGSGDLSFGGRTYRAGTTAHASYEMNTFDHYALLHAIRAGKQRADLAVFTIHAHENADGMDDNAVGDPADFLVELFHEAIDAGADVVMGGGPHSLRGIEIYKGKPIFYGLGAFFLAGHIQLTQDEQTSYYGPPPRNAPEAPTATARPRGANPSSWYDGVVAVSTFHDGRLREVRLYPLDLGQGAGPGRRGVPHLAAPDSAHRILQVLQKASDAYGTRIRIEGSIGVLEP